MRSRSTTGCPVPQARVSLLADRGMYVAPVASTRTDDDGRFTLFDVSPGDYRARARLHAARDDEASHPRPGDVRTRIRPDGPSELSLRLAGARMEIRGQVHGPDGKPAPDIIVDARMATASEDPAAVRSMLRAGGADHTTRSDADGMFTLSGLPLGAYTLRAHAGGGPEVLREGVRRGVRVTLALPPALVVAGHLTGTAFPESFVLRLQGHTGELHRQEMFTNTGGRWAFEGLAAGTYELHYEDAERRGFLVVALGDRPQTGLELAVAKIGSIRGRALDAELNTPLAGIQVTAQLTGPALRFPAWPTDSVTDDDGRFEFAGLPAGQIVFAFPAYEPSSVEATAPSGSTAEITALLRLAPDRPVRDSR